MKRPTPSLDEQNTVTTELRLVALLSLPHLCPAQVHQAGLLEETADFNRVSELVTAHHVWPSVYCTLRDHLPHWLAKPSLGDLQSRYQINCIQSQRAFVISGHLLRECRAQHIPIKILKGAPLAFKLYGDITKRHSSDIDLVVRQADLDACHLILSRAGFQCFDLHALSEAQTRAYWRTNKDIAYRNQAGVLVELHVRLSLQHFSITDRYLEALFDATPASERAHLELLYLCLHGIANYFHRLKWLIDIALYLNLQTESSGQGLIRVARAKGAMRLLSASWVLANILFDTDLPEVVMAYYDQDILCQFAVRQCLRRLNHPRDRRSLQNQLKHLITEPFLYQNTRECIGAVLIRFNPTVADIRKFNLPHRLYFLYYFMRPALVIYRRVTQPRNSAPTKPTALT